MKVLHAERMAAGPLSLIGVNVKAQWLDQVQGYGSGCASPGYATSVLGNLGVHQDEVDIFPMVCLSAQYQCGYRLCVLINDSAAWRPQWSCSILL